MGVGGIGIWQLIIILVIIMLLFGTKKLRNIGTDLGGALKGFKSAMKDGEAEADEKQRQERLAQTDEETGGTYDVKAEKVDEKNS